MSASSGATIDKAILDTADRILAERNLHDFLTLSWHVMEPDLEFIDGPHIHAMCEHLEAVSRGEIRKLIINVPPGSTKTKIISVAWPAWDWIANPGRRFLCAGNVETLVIRDALDSRRLIESNWYQEQWGDLIQFTADQNVKSRFQNTELGYRESVTVGTKVTGRKGDILVIDDPHDVREVESEANRISVKEWWRAFQNRVNDFKTANYVLIGQRTHEDDLFAHLMEGEDFEVLLIPEEYEANRAGPTSLGWVDWRTQEGELLRPERFGPEEVEAEKKRDPINYATQHQQRPSPRSGSVIRREWFRYYHVDEGRQTYVLHDPDRGERALRQRDCWPLMTVDTASTTKNYSDWTVISHWAVQYPELLLLAVVRERLEEPDAINLIRAQFRLWKPRVLAIGEKPPSVVQTLRRPGAGQQGLIVRAMEERLPIFERSLDLRNSLMAGTIYWPAEASWLNTWEGELLSFSPAMTHKFDDQVDVANHAATVVVTGDTQGRNKEMAAGLRRIRGRRNENAYERGR